MGIKLEKERDELKAQLNLAANNQTNSVLSQLGSEYPELNDANSDLTLKSVEIYKRMSERDRSSSMAFKTAVRDAAADLGILPKNKRKSTSGEGPDIGSGNSSSQSAGNSQPRSKKLDDKTLAFAKLIGLKTDDPKVVERLKARSQRAKWNKYE